jgi:hypothetical protein
MEKYKAYAHGALDGFNSGEYSNPYGQEKPEQQLAYKQGYDYGIFLYTQENEALKNAKI